MLTIGLIFELWPEVEVVAIVVMMVVVKGEVVVVVVDEVFELQVTGLVLLSLQNIMKMAGRAHLSLQ